LVNHLAAFEIIRAVDYTPLPHPHSLSLIVKCAAHDRKRNTTIYLETLCAVSEAIFLPRLPAVHLLGGSKDIPEDREGGTGIEKDGGEDLLIEIDERVNVMKGIYGRPLGGPILAHEALEAIGGGR
jgi:hypothetical protein